MTLHPLYWGFPKWSIFTPRINGIIQGVDVIILKVLFITLFSYKCLYELPDGVNEKKNLSTPLLNAYIPVRATVSLIVLVRKHHWQNFLSPHVSIFLCTSGSYEKLKSLEVIKKDHSFLNRSLTKISGMDSWYLLFYRAVAWIMIILVIVINCNT